MDGDFQPKTVETITRDGMLQMLRCSPSALLVPRCVPCIWRLSILRYLILVNKHIWALAPPIAWYLIRILALAEQMMHVDRRNWNTAWKGWNSQTSPCHHSFLSVSSPLEDNCDAGLHGVLVWIERVFLMLLVAKAGLIDSCSREMVSTAQSQQKLCREWWPAARKEKASNIHMWTENVGYSTVSFQIPTTEWKTKVFSKIWRKTQPSEWPTAFWVPLISFIYFLSVNFSSGTEHLDHCKID